jgi:hypothetical protein
MPRIFAPNEEWDYNQGDYEVFNGAFAIPATETAAIAYFTAEGFDVDTSKNALTPLDKLSRDDLDDIATYLGITLVPADGKMDVVKDIEDLISTHLLGALTVSSTDTAVLGESVIAVTEALTGTNIHKYKAAAAATALRYGDAPDSTWTTFTSGATLTGLTTGHHCSVVECNAAGTFVYKYGDVVIDATP